jgi:four helix bundle protein
MMDNKEKAAIGSYRDLIVWQKAMKLVKDVYQASASFPREEVFGLTSQLRRAAVSVPSNIAEGHGRRTTGEYRLFVSHSRGSLCELETQIMISRELGYLQNVQTNALLASTAEIGRMLNALLARLKERSTAKGA